MLTQQDIVQVLRLNSALSSKYRDDDKFVDATCEQLGINEKSRRRSLLEKSRRCLAVIGELDAVLPAKKKSALKRVLSFTVSGMKKKKEKECEFTLGQEEIIQVLRQHCPNGQVEDHAFLNELLRTLGVIDMNDRCLLWKSRLCLAVIGGVGEVRHVRVPLNLSFKEANDMIDSSDFQDESHVSKVVSVIERAVWYN